MKKLRLLLAFLLIVSISTTAFAAYRGNVPKHIVFKGLNTKAGPLNLDEGESPDCLNVYTNIFGNLIKRKGYNRLNTHPVVHPATCPTGNALFEYKVNTTTIKQVAFFDNVLHKMDNLDGTWDIIPEADNIDLSNDIVDFENFNGTLLWTNWSRDTLQSWNGVTSKTTCVEAAPKGKHIINAYKRVFISNEEDNPLRFYFSGVDSHTSWDLDNDFETLDAPQGDQAMGWGLLKGRLYGFTENTVNLISSLGGDPLFSVLRRLDGVGCGAPRSIQTAIVPALGESMIWLTKDKRIVAWNGSNIKIVSERIAVDNNQAVVSMNKIDSDALERAHAVVWKENRWYILFIPLSSSIQHAIIWDYGTDTLWPLNNQIFRSSALFDTSNGIIPYTIDNQGLTYRWFNTNADEGDAINGYWTSPKWHYDWAPYYKKGKEIWITTKTIGNFVLKYQFRYDWNTSFSTAEDLTMFDDEWLLGDVLPATLGGSEAVFQRKDIDFGFNLFQIKLSSNTSDPSFEIYSLDTLVFNTGTTQID